MKLMKRLLALLALLASVNTWASGVCTVVSVGAGGSAAGSAAITFTMPGTINPGDLLLLESGSFGSGTSTTDPTGYTLIKQGSSTSKEIWGKIAGRSESNPGITWSTKSVGNISAIHNTAGFPAVSSILGDNTTSGSGTATTLGLDGFNTTQGQGCFFQFGIKDDTTNNTNQPTAVAVTSGFTQTGFATNNTTNAPVMTGQMKNTTAGNEISQNLAVTGNTDNVATVRITLTLLDGDNVGTFTSFTDQTGATPTTVYTHGALTPTAYTNWSLMAVTGSTCEINVASRGWVTSDYINLTESFQVRGTAPSAGNHVDCVVSMGGTTVDTYTITSAAADSTAPTCSVAPASAGVTSSTVSISATCSDETDATVTHYLGVVADGASAPTGAQIAACSGGGVISGSCANGSQTNGVSKTLTSPGVLTQGTAYDPYHTVKDAAGNYKTPVKVDETTLSTDVAYYLLINDTFTASNGANAGRAPTTNNSGNTWTTGKIVTSGGAAVGVTVASNKLNIATGTSSQETGAIMDVGVLDNITYATWTTGATGGATNGALLKSRFVDSDNNKFCRFNQGSGNVRLGKTVSGTVTTLQQVTQAFTSSHSYSIAMVQVGNHTECLLDGVSIAVATDTDNATGTKIAVGTNGGTDITVFDDVYVMAGFPITNASGYIPDDTKGLFAGTSYDTGSKYWVDPSNLFAHQTCTFYRGGSYYCVVDGSFVGDDDAGIVLWNASSNLLETATLTIHTVGTGAVAPVMGAITDQACQIGIDPGALDVTQFITTQGQPAPTYSVSAGALPAGRTLSSAGVITGICTTAEVTTPTITATNATGSSGDQFTYTATGDSVPDPFPFTNKTEQATTSTISSDIVTITGLNTSSVITVAGDTGCKYSKSGGGYTASSGTVVNLDTISAQVTSGAANTTKTCTVTIGGIPQTFSVTTASNPDITPDDFTFPPATNVVPGSTQTSDTITITGINSSANVTVSNGTYSKNGAAYTASAGTAVVNDTFSVRHTANASPGLPVTTTLTVGGTSGGFTSTTALGTAPSCTQIPNVLLAVNDIYTVSANDYCSAVTSYTFTNVRSDCQVTGAVLNCLFTTAAQTEANRVTQIAATSAYGTDITNITFDIREAGTIDSGGESGTGVADPITDSVTDDLNTPL